MVYQNVADDKLSVFKLNLTLDNKSFNVLPTTEQLKDKPLQFHGVQATGASFTLAVVGFANKN